MADTDFKHCLKTEADWGAWHNNVLDEFSSKCRDLFTEGLLFAVVNDDYWASIPGNRTLDGFTVPKPTITQPNDLPLVATNTAIAKYNQEKANYSIAINTLASLKKKLLTSIGDTNVSLIAHPVTGTRFLPPLEIMTLMAEHFNTASDITIKGWKDALTVPMTTQTFREYAGQQKDIRNQLHRANQPVSGYDAVQFLIKGTSTHAAIVTSIQSYKTIRPRIADQDVLTLVEHIILHAPNNETASSLGYANSANGILSSDAVAKLIKEARDQGIREGRNRAKDGSGHVAPQQKPKISFGEKGTQYCYLHGYGFHIGSDCKQMTSSTSEYTTEQRKATSPTSSPGGNIKVSISNRY